MTFASLSHDRVETWGRFADGSAARAHISAPNDGRGAVRLRIEGRIGIGVCEP